MEDADGFSAFGGVLMCDVWWGTTRDGRTVTMLRHGKIEILLRSVFRNGRTTLANNTILNMHKKDWPSVPDHWLHH